MKKLHILLSVALLCLVALAVSAGQRAAAAADWEVITSLAVDDVVLFTNADAQKELDGIQLYGATRAGKSADYKDVPNGAFPLIVAEGIEEGTYAFITPDGKYLAWDFATANSLNTSDVLNANSSWRVTFEDGKAVIRNVDDGTHLLQYNADMNRFASYTTAKAAITLWHHTPETITVAPESGDISEALAKASKYKNVGDIVINLTEGQSYTISQPIVAPQSLTVNGNGATIDASAITGDNAVFKMPSGVTEPTAVDEIAFNNVNMKIATRLFHANKSKFWIKKLSVDNCVIAVDGTFKKSIFDCNGGGNVKLLSVNNSTIYANPKVGQNGGFFSSQSSQKPTEFGEGETQTIQITNSTLYNITNGNDMVTLREKDKEYMSFIVKNNVIVNCGKNNQFFKGLAGASDAKKAKWDVDGNIINWGGADVSGTETVKGTNDEVKNSFAGVIAFEDADNGLFNAQFNMVYATAPTSIGDPRWTVTAQQVPTDVTVAPEDGDITAALAAASEGRLAKDITINLKEGVTYTVSGSIVAPYSLTINGNGATIDASSLEAALITTPAGDLAEWMEGSLTVKDVTVKGLKKAFYASAGKNYLYNDFLIDNSIIELAGTSGNDFDFRKGGVARNFTISNSTVYAPTATANSLYTSQSAQRATEAPGVETQTFTIKNSTLYNLAKGKNFFTHRQANQKWLAYTIENSIFVNCGKSGQVVKGINQGQQGTNPTWTVKGNTFNFDGEDTSAAEATGDDSEPVQDNVAGVVAFADVEKGDFTLAYKSAQNEAKIGDPRWIVVPEDVKVTIASGDISAALDEAMAKVKVVKDIRINLTNGGEYTISKSIVVPNSLYIVTGDIMAWEQQNATIDASALEGPMITTPAEAPGEWVKGQILVDDVTVKGLKKALFASAAKNYFYEQFCIWGSVIEVAADVTTLDFTKGSVASLMISSSTIYAPTATTKAFYSSQSGQKATEYADGTEQQFIIFGSTMYNLAKGKNFFTHRQANQTWLAYNLQNNIFVNCGKSGQVVKGVNGGQSGKNPKWMIVSNLFNYDGKDTSAEESTGDADEPVEKSIPGVVTFADAAAGDFNATVTLAEGAEKPAGAGDGYHWKITYSEATAIEGVKTAEGIDLENAVIYNLNGQRVDKAQKGLYIVNGKKVVIK